MAPRRLIALMIGLLLFSSVITALIPTNKPDSLDTTSPATGRETAKPRLPTGGELLNKTIHAGKSAKRPVLSATVGDQMSLRVIGARATTVELQGLGATSDLAPGTPARFNVLLLEPGRYPVKELQSGRVLGEIQVVPREPAPGPNAGSRKQNHGPPPGAPEQA